MRGGTAGSVLRRGAGVLLLAVPFLPIRRLFGPLEGAGALVPPGEWALGLGLFGVVAWLVLLVVPDASRTPGPWAARLDRGTDGAWAAAALTLLAAVLVAVSWIAYHRSPHLIDSVVQLFQAKIFAGGQLAALPPPGGEFFVTQQMLIAPDGWYAQYPPGHPALLASGVAAGAPWMVPVLLTLAVAALVHASVRRMYGRRCARLTLLLLALCPFLWFMGASFMNHVSSLFFVSLFLYLFIRWEESGGAAWAATAGGALGAAALVRPLTAVAVAAPFVGFALASERRRHVLAAAGGFAALASLYLAYNALVTGDALLTGYVKLWGESHGLGFHETPWGGEHTFLAGVRNELLDLSLLNLFLFEWPVPALLPVGAAFAAGWTGETWDRRLLAAFLALPAAYLFYWHRDAFRGPRFLYAGIAFLVPLTARALLEITERTRGEGVQVGGLFRPVDASRWVVATLLLCAGYGVLYGAPRRFQAYASGLREMKIDISGEARRAGIDAGLLFVKVSWGNRILARVRGRGVSGGTAIRAYRNVDHCDLHQLVERAAAGSWTAGRLSSALEEAVARGGSLVKTARLNDDPTLRLRPRDALPRACREEIRYDRSGYTVYSPHLVANEPDLSGPYVVARDLRGSNTRLMERFPGRPAFMFDGERFRPVGRAGSDIGVLSPGADGAPSAIAASHAPRTP